VTRKSSGVEAALPGRAAERDVAVTEDPVWQTVISIESAAHPLSRPLQSIMAAS